MIYIYIYREYYSSLYSRYDLSRRIIRQIYRYEQFCISRETGERETREIDNPSEDGVGNGGRIQRRVLVNDCRHSERCKFFAVACHATYLWSPEERRIVGVTVPMFRGIFFDKDWQPLIILKSNLFQICFAILILPTIYLIGNSITPCNLSNPYPILYLSSGNIFNIA